MNLATEVEMYDCMVKTEDLIEQLQGRIYGYNTIPIGVRDELSRKLYEVRMTLLDYSNQLGSSLVTMGAFD